MATTDRKQRAFEARQRLVVETADGLLREHGYLGLNLDLLADEVEYSKATLYKHFSSKEDLILAVAIEHSEHRRRLFQLAANAEGHSREKMFAFGIADRLLSDSLPHAFSLSQLVSTESIWGKCSAERQNAYESSLATCFSLAIAVASEAKNAGDLPCDANPAEIVWGLVSLSKGAHLLVENSNFAEMGNPMNSLFNHYHALLDGIGWTPLSGDFDYDDSEHRLRASLLLD